MKMERSPEDRPSRRRRLRSVWVFALVAALVGGAMVVSAIDTSVEGSPAAAVGTPTISVGNVSVPEGNTAKAKLDFPITLSEPATTQISVHFTVLGQTATAGTDFTARTGTLVFKPSTTTGKTVVRKIITVTATPDTSVEQDETLVLSLTNPTGGYRLGRAWGTGTLRNDDVASGITVGLADVALDEGQAGGVRVYTLAATLSSPATASTTVNWALDSATATAGTDYASASSGKFTFSAGQYRKSLTVKVYADTVAESDETVVYRLTSATGATIQRPTGTVTIQNAYVEPAAGTDPVIAAAGDIACDPASSNFNGGLGTSDSCRMMATSDLLGSIPRLQGVLTMGDLQYEQGELANFQASYHPSWGRFFNITYPSVGNHEYLTPGAAGYYSYFGARAGDPAKGYYSFNIGSWHLIALNSMCSAVGGCGAGSPQEQWLRADLAANPTACTLAFWHHPRFSSGQHGSFSAYDAFWKALSDHGAEIVLSGHDHDYERFRPQTPTGQPSALGIRQFVVGTGGKNHYGFGPAIANSDVRNGTTYGVLAITLHPNSYDWEFIPEPGKSFTDSGTTPCH